MVEEVDKFIYLKSKINSEGNINGKINGKIQNTSKLCKITAGVLWNREIPK
jgi:hypothetical protein